MTIKDIARESGYAISTVSRVLNNHSDVSEKARKRVLAVVEANHFRLNSNAKSLKQRQTAILAIIVKGTMNVLFANIVEAMQEQSQRYGFTTAVNYLDEDADEVQYARHLCREIKPAGLAFLGGVAQHFVDGFHEIQVPSVLVTLQGNELGFENLSSVSVDDFDGARQAMEKLLRNGHRTIGVIGGDGLKSGPTRMRLAGCKAAYAAHSLPFLDALQMENARYAYESSYQAMERLLARMPNLTAVFCMSDVMAIGAMRALADHGKRIPQDISVVGYDGLPVGSFTMPRLCSVRQNAQQLAEQSILLMVACIRDQLPAQHVLLPFELIEGESVVAFGT